MRCIVKSAAGFYATDGGKPTWATSQADAKVFPSVRLAQGVVRMLAYNNIRAEVVKLGQQKPQ